MNHSHTSTPQLRRHAEDGQAFVEFALIVPVLLTIILAGISFGDLFLKYQQLSAATSEGARTGIVSRNQSSRSNLVEQATRSAAPNLTAKDLNVAITSTWNAGDPITVTATYPATVRVLGVTLFDSTLTSTRTMRVEP